MKKIYAYFVSPNETGITTEWRECERKVKGVQGARYKRFSSDEEAQQWLRAGATYTERQKRPRALPKGVYFDAGTGRGMGLVEINVTNEQGESMLPRILNPKRLTRFGTFIITRRTATNNYGELLAIYYALEIALREGIKKIFGDSRLVIDYWSKGLIKQGVFQKSVYALVSKVKLLRRQFEDGGGRIEYISGSDNPADLGFHR